MVLAGFPSARRSALARGNGVVFILCSAIVLRSANALAEHPLSIRPVIEMGSGLCAGNKAVSVRKDLLLMDLSTRGSSRERQRFIHSGSYGLPLNTSVRDYEQRLLFSLRSFRVRHFGWGARCYTGGLFVRRAMI